MMLLISAQYGAKKETAKLIEAAHENDIKTEILLNSYRHIVPTDQRLGFYGEHAFCEFLAQEFQYNLYQNSLDWVARLDHHFVQRNVVYAKLEKVIEIETSNQSILDSKILEPADDPCFDANIYTDHFPRVPLHTPVLVSTNHTWLAKYRFVIANKRIVTSCCYLVRDVFNQPVIWEAIYEDKGVTAEAFIRTVLAHNNVAPACVIDVGYMLDIKKWAICNTYPIWSADMYGCNPTKFLDAIFTGCQKIRQRASA